jgi:Protein of unknown function (DUF688)
MTLRLHLHAELRHRLHACSHNAHNVLVCVCSCLTTDHHPFAYQLRQSLSTAAAAAAAKRAAPDTAAAEESSDDSGDSDDDDNDNNDDDNAGGTVEEEQSFFANCSVERFDELMYQVGRQRVQITV